jgi:predicted RNase H-like HicB family nuclease
MQVAKIVVWEQHGGWLGYLQDYPDYWTQGETLNDLTEYLRDLHQDLTGGQIPGIRRAEELDVS